MSKFDRKEFGANITRARKAKGLSLENLGLTIGVSKGMMSRFESGESLLNVEQLELICNELEIYESDLYNSSRKIVNKENSNNPFGVDELFLYYKAYSPTTKKYGKGKFKLKLYNKPDSCDVEFLDYKTNKIYLIGHLLADGFMAFFRFENYEKTSKRLECSEIKLNIANGMDGLMFGCFNSTNGRYIPSVRKCIITKKDLEFTNEMFEQLKISNLEKENAEEEDIWYIDIENKEDFEEDFE